MGGNQDSYLQELNSTSSLRASWASLIIELMHSEIIGKFEHILYKTMLHVFTQTNEWLPPYDQLLEAGCRRLKIRLEKTKLGLVWLARDSVHTPLGKRLLQLTSNAFQHSGCLYNLCRLYVTLLRSRYYWQYWHPSFIENFSGLGLITTQKKHLHISVHPSNIIAYIALVHGIQDFYKV